MERGGKKEEKTGRTACGGFVLILYIIITQTKAAAFVTDKDHYQLFSNNIIKAGGSTAI